MREVRFEVDGESVAGSLHEPSGTPKGGVVMVHGLLSRREEFGDAPDKLAARGWRVLAIDQRGFGASGGPRGIITQERATADVLAALDFLAKDAPTLPLAIVGHSMGTVFTLRALAARPDVKAGVVVSPMRTVRAELGDAEFMGYRAAHGVSRLKTKLGLGPLVVPYKYRYEDLFVDPEAARAAEKASFLFPHVNLSNYPAFIAMDSTTSAREVHQPTLVLLAEHDKAVKPESSRAVYDALAGPKEIDTIDSGHSVWTDRSAAAAVERVDAWLAKHMAN